MVTPKTKLLQLAGSISSIDDIGGVSPDKTWSSQKIATEIDARTSAKEIIVPENTIVGFEQDSMFNGYSAARAFDATFARFALNIGDTYTILWDGKEFKAVAQDASEILAGTVVIGNCSIVGLEGNNEPFAIAVDEAGASFYCFADQEPSHTVEIYKGASYATESYVKDYVDSVLGVLENGSY